MPKESNALVLRGRKFTKASLRAISRCVKSYFDEGRTRISLEVCKALKWRQPNGWLKDRACREVLRTMHERGLIILPARIKSARLPSKDVLKKKKTCFKPETFTFGEYTLDWAKGTKLEKTWNELVEAHHYRGHKVIVGRCIKYLIRKGNQTVAAIAFSSPAWQLADRDIILEKLGLQCSQKREVIINNSRYLILPGEKIPNLASKILSVATSRVVRDWEAFYSIRPQLVETFVEPSRFEGTCYKAANWVHVGWTKGYRKHGSNHSNSQESKYIFLYGLNSRMRNRLQQLKKDKKQLCRPS